MKRIYLIFFMAVFTVTMNAQQEQLFRQDPDVKTGKLKNGLTYYIRHNEEPKERAYFYLAQKVGSIQEEPHQRGLAHFLEHMCFNGTTHFPGNRLREYLESIGVKFGADLNAYTAVEETVYNIDNVPSKVTGAIDSCLWILHDWSHDLSLDGEEIDKERGVIQEEWRSRNSPTQRMNEAMMPVIMDGSKYTDAMPIGSMDIVMNFDHQALRDYYQKWYRPDLQAVVVVGDVNVAMVEEKIKKIFADISKPKKNAAKREYYPVPDNKEPIFFLGTDKEMSSSTVRFFFKHDEAPRELRNTREYMFNSLFNSYIYGMYHDHTRDIAQRPNSPFTLAYIRDGIYSIANTKRSLTATVGCHNGKENIIKGTEAMLRELFRVRRHGFTQSEFDRYRQETLIGLDNRLKDLDKRRSSGFVNEYVRHFLDCAPIPTVQDEVAFWKEELPKLTVDDLNNYFRSLFKADESNIVIVINGPKNDTISYPTKEEMMALYHRVEAEDIAPYVDQVTNLPFLPKEPVPGKIVSETTDADGLIHLELSNGAKVIVMKTDYKKEEILMQAMAHGGASLYTPEQYRLVQLLNMTTQVMGWGNYNLADMEKKFIGVNASVQTGIEDNYQTVAGSCMPKDLKILMEKTHAAFLYPHKDADAFGALVQRLQRNMRQSKGKANNEYSDSIRITLYGDDPYTKSMEAEDYDYVNLDSLIAMYKERFADASNFSFTFVGNVDIDVLKPLLEKYIASLPSTYKHEKARPIKMIKQGSRTCQFVKEQETPKANISYTYIAPTKYDLKKYTVASILGQVLTIIYTKTIREDAGAAYSVSAGATVDYYPQEQERISVRFPTNPKNLDLAVRLIDEGIDDVAENGPAEEDVNKVKEYLLKVYEGNITVNRYWQYCLSYKWNHNGEDYHKGYVDMINSISPKDIQQMAQYIRKNGSRILVTMSTE